MNSQSAKANTTPLKKHASSERFLVELIRKGSFSSLKHASVPKKQASASPYSQTVQPNEKPQKKDGRPMITDTSLSVIEEKVRKRNRFTRNQSFTETSSEAAYMSPQPGGAGRKRSSEDTDSISSLNKVLTEKLKELGPSYDIKERFLVFQSMFSTVISLDAPFGLLLRRIKSGYEEYISQCSLPDSGKESEKIERQLREFQDILEQEQMEKETLLSTIVQLRKEKTSMTSKILDKTAKIKALEKQIGDLSQSTKTPSQDDGPLSFDQPVQEMIRNLQDEIRLLRNREQLLVGVMKSAKQRGFPMDEIFKLHSKHKKTSSYFSSESGEASRTVSGVKVPKLNLAATSQFDQLSPISPICKETDPEGSQYRDSLTSFAKEIDISTVSRREMAGDDRPTANPSN